MEPQRHVSRALHDDHMATRALLERLERLIGRHHPSQPPPQGGADRSLGHQRPQQMTPRGMP